MATLVEVLGADFIKYMEAFKPFLHVGLRNVAEYQVWTLTHFFLFPFCKNSLICLDGKSMTPRRGKTIFFRSSQQLPRLRLGPLKGFLS